MAAVQVGRIWMNGKLVPSEDAKIHVLSHVVHYGSSWFEGIRCYKTSRGSAIFRLDDHVRRLIDSARIYRAEVPYSRAELRSAIMDTIEANRLEACYIRPVVYRGFGEVGVNPAGCPIDVAIAVWEWGAYLGPEALRKGIDVCVSSWRRPGPDTSPTMAKAGGNYLSSQLVKMEALANGYAEGIALDTAGNVSEGSGENIFVVRDGVLYTPPIASGLLPGITRQSVLELAKRMKMDVVEMAIPREMLYIADEVFFSGTAAEITPIRSIDKIAISGACGPVTEKLQAAFFEIVRDGKDDLGWLTFLKRA